MAPQPKRRKINRKPSLRTENSPTEKKDTVSTSLKRPSVHATQTSSTHLKIQQAKIHAVAQAQQDGCTGNFKIFDSPFGNFLVPVIPSLAELGG